ncbi:MAG: HlyD family efflux transporter periplasmic adaptor subunit [Chloroflexi bacterium]|nr:HlyD family efflux transporter periplasmic adaptor subunit [Chloroflexota bacterium]
MTPRPLAILAAGAIGVALLLGSACTRLIEEEPTPTPLPTPAASTKPLFTVRRGSVIETVRGLGRVAASEEATMYFSQSGRLKQLHTDVRSRVKKGDLLAELEIGTLNTQIDQSRINMEVAELGLKRAVERSNTADPGVKSASARVAQSEASYAIAVANQQKVKAGATLAEMQGADASVAAARAAYEKAVADRNRLIQPKSPDDIAGASTALEKARAAVQKAQSDYDRIAHRPDVAASAQALALQQATADLNAAQARYNLATAPPRPEESAAAERTVESALAALRSAEARAAQLKAGPLPADRDAADASVRLAQANLDAAKADLEAKVLAAGLSTANFDVQIAQKQVDLAKVNLRTLEEQLQKSQLVAPFDGLVTSASGREGDVIQAYTPVVVLANPTSILVALEVAQQDLGKVALGQATTLTLDVFRGKTFPSKVIGLPNASAGPQPAALARTVKLDFTPPGPVDLGALANVTITTQRKDDVVLVENAGIRRFAGRSYVQIVGDNGRRREVDVEIGIVTDTLTEILRGVREGVRVVSQ